LQILNPQSSGTSLSILNFSSSSLDIVALEINSNDTTTNSSLSLGSPQATSSDHVTLTNSSLSLALPQATSSDHVTLTNSSLSLALPQAISSDHVTSSQVTPISNPINLSQATSTNTPCSPQVSATNPSVLDITVGHDSLAPTATLPH
jgi:hypothetical protein